MEKVRIFRKIIGLDAEIRTIEYPTKDFSRYTVQVGLFESLGETGGDILTLTYKEYPEDREIREDVVDHLKEVFEELDNSLLGNKEERQLEVLEKLKKGKEI